MSLKDALEKIQEEILKKDEIRQEIQNIVRKTTRLSKQAIFLAHKDRIEDAENLLKEASGNLSKLDEISKTYPDLYYSGLVNSAFEEYAEANLFLKIISEGKFVGPREIGVPSESYVLGLADVIGELRRRSLDLIRKGNVRDAEKCLEIMETIYAEIISRDDLLILISGLRRKCDIARRIIEATRGDVTVEIRRSMLNNAMKDLQKILESMLSSEGT
ncbi:translin family protein [Candidatus Bathyarchaeota archaeon]|nr:translin family protein [Candidatus Bathyarchaeota archaeon]